MAEQKEQKGVDNRALALMDSANDLIGEGRLREAADLLEKAAQLHHDAGRQYDESRCLQLTATLRRSTGDTQMALRLVTGAEDIRIDDPQLSVSIASELAEVAAAQSRFKDAVAEWTDAIENGLRAGLLPDGMSALLRYRGAAYIALGRLAEAEADFVRAFDLTRSVRDDDAGAFVLIEEANHLADAGQTALAQALAKRIEALATNSSTSAHFKGESHLLMARLAKTSGDLKSMECHAKQARLYALEAIAPVTYFSASAALADAFEMRNDRTEAYGMLATTWVTLSDLLGADTAASWVEPLLQAYRLSWGEAAFQESKNKYEQQRRNEAKP